MKLLMHICCGPCATYPAKSLRAAGHDIHGFFYNPNIHPLAEFRLRLESAEKMIEHMTVPADVCEEYDIEEFFRRVAFREHERCSACYHLRLETTARAASKGGFDAFTTSLLVSPYQKHELIRNIGRSVGAEHFIISTDFGPSYTPLPTEGMRSFIATLLRKGLTAQEVEFMAKVNPAKLLDLD